MSSAKSRTIPPLRVSEALRADAESVLAPGETLSAFVMDAVSRTIDFRKASWTFSPEASPVPSVRGQKATTCRPIR